MAEKPRETEPVAKPDAEEPTVKTIQIVSPKPTIGRIVTYRNRAGADMPAIISEVTDPNDGFCHLTLFPPPHEARDDGDPEWGFPHEAQVVGVTDEDGHRRGCWRWPERS